MDRCRCWSSGLLRPHMTWDELVSEVVRPEKYCSAGRWICSSVDAELRRADKERTQKKYYTKRLKRAGFSEEEISKKTSKRRVTAGTFKAIDINAL